MVSFRCIQIELSCMYVFPPASAKEYCQELILCIIAPFSDSAPVLSPCYQATPDSNTLSLDRYRSACCFHRISLVGSKEGSNSPPAGERAIVDSCRENPLTVQQG